MPIFPMSPSPSRPRRVLWLDPDSESAGKYVAALRECGLAVDRAHSLEQALPLLQKERYDVAVIELLLPDALGTDAWDQIHRSYPSLIGIITTQSASLRANVKVMAPGVVAYLLKPLRVRVIADIIHQSLGRPSQIPEVSGPRKALEPGDQVQKYEQRISLGELLEDLRAFLLSNFDYFRIQLRIELLLIAFRFRFNLRMSLVPVALAVGLAVVLMALGSVTLAAAGRSQPGEPTYPLKIALEQAELTLAPTHEFKAALYLDFASRRLDEIKRLTRKMTQSTAEPDRQATLLIEQTTAAYESQLDQIEQILPQVLVSDSPDAIEIVSSAEKILAENEQELTALTASAPKTAHPALARAVSVSQKVRQTARKTTLGVFQRNPTRALVELAPATPGPVLEPTNTAPPIVQVPSQTPPAAPAGIPLSPTGTTVPWTSTSSADPTGIPPAVTQVSPTNTLQRTSTPFSLTLTPSATRTLIPPSASPTPTSTLPLPSPTTVPTETLIPPTLTSTPSLTPIPPSATAVPTDTPTPTETPMLPTDTPTPTETPVPPTDTPVSTDTPTPTETPVPPTDTPVPTDTPTPTETPVPPTNTAAPTDTPLPTDTPTSTNYVVTDDGVDSGVSNPIETPTAANRSLATNTTVPTAAPLPLPETPAPTDLANAN